MKIIYSDKEKLHHPQHEWSDGKLIPYQEKNIRAELIKKEVIKENLGWMLMDAQEFSLEHIKAVTDPQMVDFIESCKNLRDDESVFPHVFPYRDFTPAFNQHPIINLRKAGYYCFDVGIEIDRNTFTAAKAAVDTALTGAELIVNNKESIVFSLSRPPGHHAGYNFFGGYCIFNNAAIAAYRLVKQFETVAILDIDFHHGNGTQDIFYEQSNVLYVSLHADPSQFFPYYSGFEDEKGQKLGLGYNINIPLPKNISTKDYKDKLKFAVKKIKEYQPGALVISMGFDTYKKDPIGGFDISTDDYREIALICGEIQVPILAVLEGGYNINSLKDNGYSFIKGLMEIY